MNKHPMPKTARQYLHKIELERNVEIIYAVESGSRAWGFASNNSDFDIRFVYVRPRRSYLSLTSRRDVIESKEFNFNDPLIDMGGWDILKLLDQASNSNPQVLEWLHSDIIYTEDSTFVDELRRIMFDFNIRRVMHHYAGHAQRIYHEQLKGVGEKVRVKSYLYVIRCILMSLRMHKAPDKFPLTIRVDSLLSALNFSSEIATIAPVINQMIGQRKLFGEDHNINTIPELDAFIQKYLVPMKEWANDADDSRTPDMLSLEDLSYETIQRYA